MAVINRMFKNMSQQLTEQSVSWGSLMVWVSGLTVVILMMVFFSQS